MQTNNKMAVAPVGKLIWQMSIPPLISMFLQYSYNLIDSAFVARLSENALTAVSLSFPITTLMNAASIWIGVGVNVLIAGYLGQKKQDEANPQYGAYRNPEDDTGHREHDCSHVVSDCRRGGQFCTQSHSDFWRWHFPLYGNPWLCGGYGCGLFVVHDFGVCFAAGQKTESADKNQRLSLAETDDPPYFCLWPAIFYYERPQFVYGDVRQSVSGGVF